MDVLDIIHVFKVILDKEGKAKAKQALKEASPKLIELLIKELISRDYFEIGIHTNWDKNGNDVNTSVITMDQYEEETLSLLMFSAKKLMLEVNFWGIDDEEHILSCKLGKEDLKIVPQGLINLMQEVLTNDEPATITPKQIRNTGR